MRFSHKYWLGIAIVAALGTVLGGTLGSLMLPSQQQLAADPESATDSWLAEVSAEPGPSGTKASKSKGFLRSLNLSKTQIQQLQAIRTQHQPKIREQMRRFRAAKARLDQLLVTDAANAELQTQFNEMQSQRQALEKARFANLTALREILTPPQRQAFAQKRQERLQKQRRQKLDRWMQQQ